MSFGPDMKYLLTVGIVRRSALLESVFSPEKGAGLCGARLNIGSSD